MGPHKGGGSEDEKGAGLRKGYCCGDARSGKWSELREAGHGDAGLHCGL